MNDISAQLHALLGQPLQELAPAYYLQLHLRLGPHWLSTEDSDWQLRDGDGELLAERAAFERGDEEAVLRSALGRLRGACVAAVHQRSYARLALRFDAGATLTLDAGDEFAEAWGLHSADGLWISARPGELLLMRADVPIRQAEASPLARSAEPLGRVLG